jgi:hypothetical protein
LADGRLSPAEARTALPDLDHAIGALAQLRALVITTANSDPSG